MADTTHIEWTDATWNIITGCDMVDAGCTHCYAMQLAGSRLRNHPSRQGLTRVTGGRAKWTGEVRFNEGWLDQPLRWTRPRRIFVCAHGDLFHPAVPDEWIDRVFAVMALATQHTFQVLTKRPERAAAYLRRVSAQALIEIWAVEAGKIGGDEAAVRVLQNDRTALRNVWLGTSVSDQASADLRIPHLLAAPAAVRFLSAEPLLGPVDLKHLVAGHPGYALQDFGVQILGHGRLDWVIVGGESGAHARPMHPDWARSLRDQCVAAGVPFFFKQVGEWTAWEEFGSLPLFRNPYTLAEEDRHNLFPADWDNTPSWDDGLRFVDTDRHVAFHRVGKKGAGRLLDGRTWDQMPGVSHG